MVCVVKIHQAFAYGSGECHWHCCVYQVLLSASKQLLIIKLLLGKQIPDSAT